MLLTAPVRDDYQSFPDLDQGLNTWRVSSRERCLLIIDAARYGEDDVFQQIYTFDDNPNWFWLFDETPFEAYKSAGPVVIDTVLDSALCKRAISHWGADEALTILVSKREAGLVLAGIRNSLIINCETFGPCFIRPYDARFLEVLNGCEPDKLNSLIGEGDAIIWAINGGEDIYWSCSRGGGSEGFHAHQPRSFEELLTWVSGWSRCMVLAKECEYAPSRQVEMIRKMWSAGHVCPASDAELKLLWQHAEKEFHGLHEKDFSNVSD